MTATLFRHPLLTAPLLLVSLLQGANAASARPNVILILADDLAPGDLSSDVCRTPNLDQLARQSLVCTNAYAGSCVCAPSRACLLTGRYPHRTGVVTLNMNRYPDLTRLHRSERTIADDFSIAGYVTGLIGKWHTGQGRHYHPMDRGFNEFEGFFGSETIDYFDYRLTLGRQRQPASRDGYLTDDLSNRAIEFVHRHRDHPFFLHLAHYAPHRPLQAPQALIQSYVDRGLNRSTATVYAMIEVMDRGIGRLTETLRELDLAEKTLVVFASDNGPDPLAGDRPNRPFRGTKYMVNEGGIRVPLMFHWPETLQPSVSERVIHFADILPTLLTVCQIDRPAAAPPLDGVAYGPVTGIESQAPPMRFWQWNREMPNYTQNAAVRMGSHKLVRPFVTRNGNVVDSHLPPRLYDLQTDPGEQMDLSGEQPELTQRLDDALSDWSRSVEADRRAGAGEGNR